jgi:class 3 adenylate cyclase
MALFGYPVAQENDAERAVRAALAIQRSLVELNSKNASFGKPALAARIAIDLGPVVIDETERSLFLLLGYAVVGEMGSSAPRWLAVRNVSDPQIKADGLTLKQQAQIAAQIYKGFGRWSSVCSAITCWASIVAM